MLIKNAEIWRVGQGDVRIANGRIIAVGAVEQAVGEAVVDAKGGLLIPGLHDHHIHLAATAVAQSSVQCGPPDVNSLDQLATALTGNTAWLRGIGYHESIGGLLTRVVLDELAPHRPVRIQHRSGRMWFLNSLAINLLLSHADPPPGLDVDTGQLFDDDAWLKQALNSHPPGLGALSLQLAHYGITGVTDMSPANDPAMAAHFVAEQDSKLLVQRLHIAGKLDLKEVGRLTIGPAKLHLHENHLPDMGIAADFVRAAHRQGRGVAVHCTTRVELVFALAVFDEVGSLTGDRIEHCGVADEALVQHMAGLGMWVVSQPHFVAERGDQYLKDVEAVDRPHLYRLQSLQEAGLPLAAGSDGPYGSIDPWASMRAAVSRQTVSGAVIGAAEALTPEDALRLWLKDPSDVRRDRKIEVGAAADLCLLLHPWSTAQERLLAEDVRCVWVGGSIVNNRVNQAPS